MPTNKIGRMSLTSLLATIVLVAFVAIGVGIVLNSEADNKGAPFAVIEKNSASILDNDFLAMVSLVRTLEINKAILNSAAFTRLRDLRTAVSPEPIGKTNPFSNE